MQHLFLSSAKICQRVLRRKRWGVSLLMLVLAMSSAQAQSLTFGPPLTRAYFSTGSPAAKHLLAGDVNNDGNQDIMVMNTSSYPSTDYSTTPAQDYYPEAMGLMLGNGDGTFQYAVNIACGSSPSDFVLADINGDGNLDLASVQIADRRYSLSVRVRLGNGNGTFQPEVLFGLSGSPRDYGLLRMADLNRDGRPDLVLVTGDGSADRIYVLKGSSTGLFQVQAPVTTTYPYEITMSDMSLADLNKDGIPDLTMASSLPAVPVYVMLGTGTGSFSAGVTYAQTSGIGVSIAVADVTNDGNQDILYASDNNYFGPSIDVRQGTGLGTFTNTYTGYNPSLTSWSAYQARPTDVRATDMNGDGRPEILYTYTTNGSGQIGVIVNNIGIGGYTKQGLPIGSQARDLLIADFNGDGKPDIATFGVIGASYVVVLLNTTTFPVPLPVQLVNFSARRVGSRAVLDWATASEKNNAGFTVERSPDGKAWQAVATVAGHGSSTLAHQYNYSEPALNVAYYRLAQRDHDGTVTYSPVRMLAAGLEPGQLFPNPCNGTFTLSPTAHAVRVQDLLGRVVPATLSANGQVQLTQPQPGHYLVDWLEADETPQRAKLAVY